MFLGASMMQRDKPVDTGFKVQFLNLATPDGAGVPPFMRYTPFYLKHNAKLCRERSESA
jgi:hypothetical protein